MTKQLGIDLGTANTLVYLKGKGIILREPSVVAQNQVNKRVREVGKAAKNMLGKTPDNIVASRPLKDGVIADFDITAKMLRSFFSKVHAGGILSRPNVVICIPYGITEVERRAVEDATYEAGAKNVALIDEPIAAAVGSGLKISGPHGCMIVDVGGGTTEVAVISLKGIVCSHSVKTAGNQFDEAIIQFMKKSKNGVVIGEATAEELKKTIGSVHPSADRGEIEINSVLKGRSAPMIISSAEIREALNEPMEKIISAIQQVLSVTPPELAADLMDFGIRLTGGGALLGGLPQLITERTGLRVTMPKQPMESVALGLGKILEDPELSDLIRYRAR